MELVPFEPDQLAELVEFVITHLPERYETRVFLDIRKAWPEGFFIARHQGVMVGVAAGSLLASRKLRVLLLVLAPAYRNHRYGRWMLEELLVRARDRDCASVTLEVRDGSPAMGFYRHLNFSVADHLPCYYQDGTDAVVMVRRL